MNDLRTTLLRPRGFSLQAASEFFCGFTPGRGTAFSRDGALTIVFHLDQSFDPVGVLVREGRDQLSLEVAGTRDLDRVEKQVARVLGLEGDADAWLSLGERDPVVGRLQSLFPGFFTVTKASPYDAAMWGVISPRMNLRAAADLKESIARDLGDEITVGGETHHLFPHPRRVLEIREVAGLTREKVERMKSVARAALDGKLDADRLRAMDELDALADLQTIRGVGPWTASHILHRGAAPMDALPAAEPRVLHGFAEAYGTEVPTHEAFARIANGWRPFRMWVSVLLARTLARAGGWHKPELAGERAAAAKALGARVRRRAPTGGGASRSSAAHREAALSGQLRQVQLPKYL